MTYALGFRIGVAVASAQFAAQVALLERDLARAEADADYWYFEANNPDEARARERALSSTASIDARAHRQESAQRWAAQSSGKKAS